MKHHHYHHPVRIWPKLIFGAVGAFFIVHGSVLIGFIVVLLCLAALNGRRR